MFYLKGLGVSILIGIVFLMSVLVLTPKAEFIDSDIFYYYEDAINYVEQSGIVNGYSDNSFKPNNKITRAEFTKIIINARFGDSEIASCSSYSFSDVLSDNTFAKYICVAKENSILSGYTDGNFYPGKYISNGEAAKIIANAYGLTNTQNPVGEDKFREFINALAYKHAWSKLNNNLDNNLKRGDMAEIIYRLDNNITNKETIYSYDDMLQLGENTCVSKGGIYDQYAGAMGCKGLNQTTCESIGGSMSDDLQCWNNDDCSGTSEYICYFPEYSHIVTAQPSEYEANSSEFQGFKYCDNANSVCNVYGVNKSEMMNLLGTSVVVEGESFTLYFNSAEPQGVAAGTQYYLAEGFGFIKENK